MIGKICPDVRGGQVWADGRVFDCKGRDLGIRAPGTNQGIRWAADMTTQVIDFNYAAGEKQRGVVNDIAHGVMLAPEGTLTNNHTKGNPCLVADVLGDFRENLILRTEDDRFIRIYMNTEVTDHKLFTMMQDLQTIYEGITAWNSEINGKNKLDTLQQRGEILRRMAEAVGEISSAVKLSPAFIPFS